MRTAERILLGSATALGAIAVMFGLTLAFVLSPFLTAGVLCAILLLFELRHRA